VKLLAISDSESAMCARTVQQLGPLSPEELHAGLALLRARVLKRGEFLLQAGRVADHLALVSLGLLREYLVTPHGGEHSKAFVRPGELSGSLAELISRVPSRASIVAVDPSRVLVASYAAYKELVAGSSGWLRVHCAVLEAMFLRKAEREYELMSLDAEARYNALVARSPTIEARIAARHVASYLGITPEYLSRLRRKRREA
jgi:CRP-like cAMP-binding protein